MLREEEHIKDIDRVEFEKVFTPDIKRIINIIRRYGFDIRVVGGAVRDFLLQHPPRDVDFATNADPSELIYMLQLEGIEFDSKGISHGTIKAKFGDDKIDITSISYKLSIVDDQIKITRRNSWEQDALHRDLTINSLSMDLNGRIYDYVGGLEDLANQIIRFNPSTAENIPNDPHLIMRWFKALGYFSNPKWPRKDWQAIREHIQSLQTIKDDSKTAKEITAIMQSKNAHNVLKLMCSLRASYYLDLDCNI